MSNSSQSMLYPLTFHPTFKDYPWGGRNLETRLGRKIPDGIIAESWEIAGHPNGSSIVQNGEFAGMTLPQVQEQIGEALVGTRNQHALQLGKFPLLIKLLDANRWLSVQVHPDDEYGLANEGEFGKTEMWVVLHAEPNAELIYGFKPGITKAKFQQAIENDQVAETLHRVTVQPGDVVFVPAGSIHALGPGTIVAEIQQNSDTTYRIYDWGRPRPIHVEQALDVLNFDLVEPGTLQAESIEANGHTSNIQGEIIGHCQYFHTERLAIPAGETFTGNCIGDTFEIWGVLDGKAQIHWQEQSLKLNAISWSLLPAMMGAYQVKAVEDSTLLRVYTP